MYQVNLLQLSWFTLFSVPQSIEWVVYSIPFDILGHMHSLCSRLSYKIKFVIIVRSVNLDNVL